MVCNGEILERTIRRIKECGGDDALNKNPHSQPPGIIPPRRESENLCSQSLKKEESEIRKFPHGPASAQAQTFHPFQANFKGTYILVGLLLILGSAYWAPLPHIHIHI